MSCAGVLDSCPLHLPLGKEQDGLSRGMGKKRGREEAKWEEIREGLKLILI